MTAQRVDLFGVECNTGVADANGVVWNVEKLPGWSSPILVSERALVTGRAGRTLLREGHDERIIEVHGSVEAPDNDAAWLAYEQLSIMPAIGTSGEVIVYHDIPKKAVVRQGEAPRADEPLNGVFQFLLTLTAFNPCYKLAVTQKSQTVAAGATESLTNDGTAPAQLVVTTTSSGTVWLTENTSGQALKSKASMASGTILDSSRRRVFSSGGVYLRGVMDPTSEWLSIPRNSTVTVTNSGTAPLTVTWYDTYA